MGKKRNVYHRKRRRYLLVKARWEGLFSVTMKNYVHIYDLDKVV